MNGLIMNQHNAEANQTQDGKVKIKFFLIPSIIISIFLSLLLTIIANVLF